MPPPSGISPRRTNTWMMRACSAAITRSQASTIDAPPPATVPLSAAITGTSQSAIAPVRRWMPVRIARAASPATRSGAPSGLSGITMPPARRSAPVQKCFSPAAVITTQRTS